MSRVPIFSGILLLFSASISGPAAAAATQASGRDWTARWVWVAEGPGSDGGDRFACFRRSFRLDSLPERAELFISADSRYQLWVNGRCVGRGPARCHPAYQQYDRYDLLPFLRPGPNVLAMEAVHYGRAMSWYVPGRPGLLAELVMRGAGGESRIATGDGHFKGIINPAHVPTTIYSPIGLAETYDSRLEIPSWREADFDDSQWPVAVPLEGRNRSREFAGVVPMEPWRRMEERTIPFMAETEVAPARVIEVGTLKDRPAFGDSLARRMFAEALEPDPGAVMNAEAVLDADGKSCIIRPPGPGRSVYITLDFGREVTGYYRLRATDGANGALADMATSEWLVDPWETDPTEAPPVRPGERGRVYAVAGGGQAKRVILRDGPVDWRSLHWRGFRYMQVNFRDVTRPIAIDAVTVDHFTYPTGNRGSFRCSDNLLNRIWDAGAYTVKLCMHDAYEDCPSREQRQWVGDAYVEMMINFACYGDTALAARWLRQTAQSQGPDGMTLMYCPRVEGPGGIIPDYNLHWIRGLRDYYLYSGDSATARELFPAVVRSLGWWSAYVGEDGLLWDVPGWVFIDWADLVRNGACTALNALYAGTLGDAAYLAERLGETERAAGFRAAADRTAEAINRLLWDPKRNAYVDALTDRGRVERVSQQANGFLLYFGLPPPDRLVPMIDHIADPFRTKLKLERKSKEFAPAFDDRSDVVLAQPFGWFFLAQGLDRAGQLDLVLQNFRKRWGVMIEGDSPTLWETWEPNASACHGWSGAPTYVLSTSVLGVKPLEPGFERFRVAPQPSGLDWAEGVVPSPRGDISVRWERVRGGFDLTLTVPTGTVAEAAVPAPAESNLEMGGRNVWFSGSPRDGYPGLRRIYRAGGWLVAVLEPGSYTIGRRP